MFSDSTCCFVGTSDQMAGSGKGELIDKFDIVCRTLGSSGKILHNPNDLGSYTDVLFVNDKVSKLHNPLDALHLKEKSVRMVVFRDKVPEGADYLTDNGIEIGSTRNNVIYGLNSVPMMAVHVTNWLLNKNAGTVYITGCDLYASYRKDPLANSASWLDGYQAEWDNSPPSSQHDIDGHFAWLWRRLHSCEVFCDDLLAEEVNKWWRKKIEALN